MFTLGAIRYTTYVSHQQTLAREKHARDMTEAGVQTEDTMFFGPGGVPSARSEIAAAAGDSDAVLASASSKTGAGQHGVSYVSLG